MHYSRSIFSLMALKLSLAARGSGCGRSNAANASNVSDSVVAVNIREIILYLFIFYMKMSLSNCILAYLNLCKISLPIDALVPSSLLRRLN
jgi:hypothetical protein